MAEQVEVKVGQVWEPRDPRAKARYVTVFRFSGNGEVAVHPEGSSVPRWLKVTSLQSRYRFLGSA